jgi:hypothetical protein
LSIKILLGWEVQSLPIDPQAARISKKISSLADQSAAKVFCPDCAGLGRQQGIPRLKSRCFAANLSAFQRSSRIGFTQLPSHLTGFPIAIPTSGRSVAAPALILTQLRAL